MRRPAFYFALMVLAGAVAGRAIALPEWLVICLGAVLLVSGCVLAWKGRNPSRAELRHPAGHMLMGALLLISFWQQNGLMREEALARRQVSALEQRGAMQISGIVAVEPTIKSRRVSLVLRDVAISAKGQAGSPQDNGSLPRNGGALAARIQVVVFAPAADTLISRLPVRGEAFRVMSEINRLPEASHPDLFDYSAFLGSKGIFGQANVFSPNDISRAPENDNRLESAIFTPLMNWRRQIVRMLQDSFPPAQAALMNAMLMGDTSELDPEMKRDFVRSGTAHLYSVSGIHTAFLALMIFTICRLLHMSPRWSSWTVIISLSLYCAMIGLQAPVVRSALMSACLTLPYLARRSVDALTALCFALFWTVLLNPHAPFQTDFQFSYLCTFGIICLHPVLVEILVIPLEKYSFRARRWIARYNTWLSGPLALSVASQVAVLPLLAIYYRQFSLLGFISNLVLVPLSTLLLASGWLMSLLWPISAGAASSLAALSSPILGLFTWLLRFFARPDFAVMDIPRMPWWLILSYFLVLFTGPHMLMRVSPGAVQMRRANFLLRLTGLALVLAWWPLIANYTWNGDVGQMKVTMLDVGQGDSFLVESPNGRSMLIDTGPSSASGRVIEFLRSKGIYDLSALVLTHPDSDHIGGATALMSDISVQSLIRSSAQSASQVKGELDAAIVANAIPVRDVDEGDTIKGFEPAKIAVLGPVASDSPQSDTNGQSVVLKVSYKDMDFLFMGDADYSEEMQIMRAEGDAVQSEVLKVGHHGSASSTGGLFLDRVAPKWALISAGEHNRYGHPSPETLQRLRKEKTEALDTMDSGFVEMRTDGERMWVRKGKGEN